MKAINVVPQSIDKNDYKTSNFNDRFTLEDAENIPPNMQYTRDMRYNNTQDYEDNMYDRRAGEKGYNNKQILSNRPFNIPFKTEKETTIGSRRDKFNNKTPDNNKFFSFKEGQAPPSDGSRFQAKFDTRRMPEPTHFGILQDISVDENSFERHNKEGNREKEYNYHEKPLNDDFNMILRNEKSLDMRKSTSSKAIIFD